MKESYERTRIALPSGELEKDVMRFLRGIGLEFAASDKRYLHPGSRNNANGFGYCQSQ